MAHGTERVIDDIREHAYQISVMLTATFLHYIFNTILKFGSRIGDSCILLVWCANTLCLKFQALADFQYIDSSGRDQGSNVRRKSQSLVSLVNDKERIQEVRQKALATRDK